MTKYVTPLTDPQATTLGMNDYLRYTPPGEPVLATPAMALVRGREIETRYRAGTEIIVDAPDTLAFPYVAPAVHIGPENYAVMQSYSGPDVETFSFSFWARTAAAPLPTPTHGQVWTIATLPPDVTRVPQDWFFEQAGGLNPASFTGGTYAPGESGVGTPYQWLTFGDLPYFELLWKHYLGSYNTATSKLAIYINDVLALNAFSDVVEPLYPMQMRGKAFKIIQAYDEENTNNQGFVGDMADLWLAPGVSLLDATDKIPVETRRRFIDATFKPVCPAMFPPGGVLFSGTPDAFKTNRGSAGPFQWQGTLAAAATSPSS